MSSRARVFAVLAGGIAAAAAACGTSDVLEQTAPGEPTAVPTGCIGFSGMLQLQMCGPDTGAHVPGASQWCISQCYGAARSCYASRDACEEACITAEADNYACRTELHQMLDCASSHANIVCTDAGAEVGPKACQAEVAAFQACSDPDSGSDDAEAADASDELAPEG